MSADRLSARFAACKSQGRAALVTFVTAGDPTVADTPAILDALVEAGADIIELGTPFTDPMAWAPARRRRTSSPSPPPSVIDIPTRRWS